MFTISTMLALSHGFAALRRMTRAAPSRRAIDKRPCAAIAPSVPASDGATLPRQDRSRRWLVGALVAVVAVAAALGSGDGARAVDNSHKRPDYGSKLAFKLECELLGGTFREDGQGNTLCYTPYGGVIECDANGNDCWYDPDGADTGSGDFPRPPIGPGNQVPDRPAQVDDSSSGDAGPDVVASDNGQHPDRDHGKRTRKGHKGKKGGKHRT